MSSSDPRLIDFAQARVNRIAEAIDGLAEQIKMTNHHVERLNREVGELRGEVGGLRGEIVSLRSDMDKRFDRVDFEIRDSRSEVILQANQVINAHQQAMRAMMRLDDLEQRPDEPKP
jgi:predicted RNase H-like nuclease (RuvC/YqgF family)